MTEPLVVLLYSPRFIPNDVLEFVQTFVPPGFRWQPLDQGADAAARHAAFAAADYLFAYPGDPTAAELGAARHLKLFQLLSAGHDWLDLDAFRQAGVVLAGNQGSNAISTAEHAVLLMLALLKQLPQHHAATASGEWLAMSRTMQLHELRAKTVGLLGFGNIARHVASRVKAFGAKVVYHKPQRALPSLEQELGVEYRTLAELLEQSDILSLHVPLTPHTRGIVGAEAMARMKRGSWIVNTARGALVDEQALIRALSDGQLAGAGLDVFAQEPVDPHSALLRLPNVVLTPHVAGVTRDTWAHRLAVAWNNVRLVEIGQPPMARLA